MSLSAAAQCRAGRPGVNAQKPKIRQFGYDPEIPSISSFVPLFPSLLRLGPLSMRPAVVLSSAQEEGQ